MYKFIMGPALADVHVVVSQNKEPLYRPQYSIILIMGTPNMVLLILGKPHGLLNPEDQRKPTEQRKPEPLTGDSLACC